MGQRNMVYSGPMLDTEMEHAHPRQEPCLIPYGIITPFPPPNNNNLRILPPPGNRPSFDSHHLPENHGPLTYNGVDHHTPAMAPSLRTRIFPVPVNHGVHDQQPFPSIHGSFERNGAYKRKNAEGYPGNFQCFYPAPGSSSSAADPAMAHNHSHLVPGNYGGQPLRPGPPGPWVDHQFCAPGIPYLQGSINGGGMEAPNLGIHGYGNSNSVAFVHRPPMPPHHLPMPPLPVHNVDFHPQMASTSRRVSITGGTTSVNPFESGLEPGPRFVVPTPPAGVRVFRPHRWEMIESTGRHRSFPHLRVLPEDGVAILDVFDNQEVGHSVDHHRDLRLDIDQMSYEELLALGEQIGSVGSGLSDGFIVDHLKTRTFASSKSSSHSPSPDHELNLCVICQTDYNDEENIGMLDCKHEYHVECIKKWLVVKNTCPVCKSTALGKKS